MSDQTVSLTTQPELVRVPLVANRRSFAWVSDKVSAICEERARLWWWAFFLPLAAIALFGLFCIG